MTMEKILEQLKIEKDNVSDVLVSRTSVLKEYINAVNEAITATVRSIELTKKETEDIIVQNEQAKKDLGTTLNSHESAKTVHLSFVAEKEKQISGLSDLVESKNGEILKINNIIGGLMTEYRSIEEQLTNARAQISATERLLKGSKDQETALITSIANKTVQDNTLTRKIEEGNKQFTKLTTDLAILESRKK